MEKLASPKKTIETIQKYGFTFQKKYGQNFLIDERVIGRILDAAGITAQDCVLEIGPGFGTLTQYLAERAGAVVAVEIDRMLIPVLQETLAPYPNVTILNQDILKTDIGAISREKGDGRAMKVVANLPYYITTPIIMDLLESHAPVESMTMMVQKEVAERMQAGPGGKDYGALSLAVQYHARAQIVAHVPPNCFLPRPKVGSAVIHLTRYAHPPVEVEDEAFLFALIRAAFGQRRKTLPNAVGNAAALPVTRQRAARALSRMGLPETIRGEALTLEQFARLAALLKADEESTGGDYGEDHT